MAEYPRGDLELSELALGTVTVPRWRLHTEKATVWVGMAVGTALGLAIIIVAANVAMYDASVYNLVLIVLSTFILLPTLMSVRKARRVHDRIYVELPGERPGQAVAALEESLRTSFLDFRKEWVDHPTMPFPAIGLWKYVVDGYGPTALVVDCGHRTLVCIGPVVPANAEQASRLAYGVSRMLLRTHGPVEGHPARRHVWPRRP